MDKIKSIFNYPKKDIAEKDPGLYHWERKVFVKDDLRALRNLLEKLKKSKSATWHSKNDKRFSEGYFSKSRFSNKETNQRVMLKMTYSNSMNAHRLFRKYYMPQMQKSNVIEKPQLFGTSDEEYEKQNCWTF